MLHTWLNLLINFSVSSQVFFTLGAIMKQNRNKEQHTLKTFKVGGSSVLLETRLS